MPAVLASATWPALLIPVSLSSVEHCGLAASASLFGARKLLLNALLDDSFSRGDSLAMYFSSDSSRLY